MQFQFSKLTTHYPPLGKTRSFAYEVIFVRHSCIVRGEDKTRGHVDGNGLPVSYVRVLISTNVSSCWRLKASSVLLIPWIMASEATVLIRRAEI